MRYFVIADDGTKYGPADEPTLRQWISEGRLTPETWLEEEGSGQRMKARFVVPPAQSTAPPSGPAPAAPVQSPYPRPEAFDNGQKQITAGWVCAVLSLLCCPIGFGIAAIILANQARQKGHPGAQTLLIASIILLVVGIGAGVVFNLPGLNPFERLLNR